MWCLYEATVFKKLLAKLDKYKFFGYLKETIKYNFNHHIK
jgi:hypothetical protein